MPWEIYEQWPQILSPGRINTYQKEQLKYIQGQINKIRNSVYSY